MLVQISHYQFSLREPYEAGQVLSEPEAKVMNAARAERVKKILGRLVERHAEGGAVLSPEATEVLLADAREIDEKFSLSTHQLLGPKGPKGGLAKEIEAVAREFWAQGFRHQMGREPKDEELDAAALDLEGARAEGHRRYVARQEVLKGAMADLQGGPEE